MGLVWAALRLVTGKSLSARPPRLAASFVTVLTSCLAQEASPLLLTEEASLLAAPAKSPQAGNAQGLSLCYLAQWARPIAAQAPKENRLGTQPFQAIIKKLAAPLAVQAPATALDPKFCDARRSFGFGAAMRQNMQTSSLASAKRAARDDPA